MYPESNKIGALQARAKMYQQIRHFFAERDVLEVETPVMVGRTVSDPYLKAFAVDNYFLQTSPEYAMKRLLVDGCGSIYQICKVFRYEEAGSLHNPEFTMLEWYRVGFDHMQLMAEVDALLQLVLGCAPAKKVSYQELFMQHLDINPHVADIDVLQTCANQQGINLTAAALQDLTVTDWLQLLMSHVLEPKLTGPAPWFIYDFPVPQAALAKIIHKECPVAARFEVYVEGIELANGYYELQDAKEQKQRFLDDNTKRANQGLPIVVADERLLAALDKGMPDCAGIALGLDRFLMVRQKTKSIKNVLSFSIEDA